MKYCKKLAGTYGIEMFVQDLRLDDDLPLIHPSGLQTWAASTPIISAVFHQSL